MKDEDKAKAMKIEKLRKQAEDKSLPMEARNQLKDRANMLEQEMAKKAGVRLAKGGAVMPSRGGRTATNKEKKMMYGGMAEKMPMKPAMAKGGMAKKAKK